MFVNTKYFYVLNHGRQLFCLMFGQEQCYINSFLLFYNEAIILWWKQIVCDLKQYAYCVLLSVITVCVCLKKFIYLVVFLWHVY